MTDRYAVVPAHLVRQAENFTDAAAAAVAASHLVSKDRVPRTVVQLVTEVTASAKPHVQMVQIAEVARG
jgi:hypothetical protein